MMLQISLDQEPAWKTLVERWYQLDEVSYALAEAAYQVRPELQGHLDMIVLASIGASNRADLKFIQSGSTSPAQFVYTLANVGISALCQILQWKGQTRCVVCRENAIDSVHREAMEIAKLQNKSVALFIVDQKSTQATKQIQFFHFPKSQELL